MHSYIFCENTVASNKNSYVNFTKAILCHSKVGKEPCNTCRACTTFDTNNHPDVIYISSEKATIGVNVVREQINRQINIKPYGDHKVIIIKNAHTLTIAAQNALLKTLEEPPKYAVIILLAQTTANFLLTLLSRCGVIRIQQDEVFVSDQIQDFTIDFLTDLSSQSLNGVFDFFKILEKHKENIEQVLETMQLFFRDCLVFKQTHKEDFVIQKSKLNAIAYYIENVTTESLIKRLETIGFTMNALSKNANFQMAMELMLIKIRRS
ncbi:MAG: hypothetical protein FWG63_02435 [Defluviitaleaceae bacterium]|nr:hypothetical protein [Defluviitaleaceae bacterium]